MNEHGTIQERSFLISVRIIKMVQELPKTPAGYAIANQIIRSGTSIGANIAEAQDASSRVDFTHCLNISLKEARETEYWLRLIVESEIQPRSKMTPLLVEIEEIVKILRASLKKLRNK